MIRDGSGAANQDGKQKAGQSVSGYIPCSLDDAKKSRCGFGDHARRPALREATRYEASASPLGGPSLRSQLGTSFGMSASRFDSQH